MKTPIDMGITSRTIEEYEWEEHEIYLVEVASTACNPIHRAMFFSGFLGNAGRPCAYSKLFHPSYPDYAYLNQTYYLKVIEKLNIDLEGDPKNET